MHYSMSINGKVEEGTMEMDTANNVERFSTGSGSEEAVEVHDFEIVSLSDSKHPKKKEREKQLLLRDSREADQ